MGEAGVLLIRYPSCQLSLAFVCCAAAYSCWVILDLHVWDCRDLCCCQATWSWWQSASTSHFICNTTNCESAFFSVFLCCLGVWVWLCENRCVKSMFLCWKYRLLISLLSTVFLWYASVNCGTQYSSEFIHSYFLFFGTLLCISCLIDMVLHLYRKMVPQISSLLMVCTTTMEGMPASTSSRTYPCG